MKIDYNKLCDKYPKIPENTIYTICLYVNEGIPTGSFCEAVLINDFLGAFSRADEYNTQAMRHIAALVYNDIPSNCHGSKYIYNNWISIGGLNKNQGTEQ